MKASIEYNESINRRYKLNTGKAVNRYDNSKAVRYALEYAVNPNREYIFFKSYEDGGGDCSNFVSQCLFAGGAPMDFKSVNPWWYKKSGLPKENTARWSFSWSVAHSLYLCLLGRSKRNDSGLQGIEVYDINDLDVGDIIQYENSEGRIYHSAIITSFIFVNEKRLPLVSQHSYNAVDASFIKAKAVKVHLIKIFVK